MYVSVIGKRGENEFSPAVNYIASHLTKYKFSGNYNYDKRMNNLVISLMSYIHII